MRLKGIKTNTSREREKIMTRNKRQTHRNGKYKIRQNYKNNMTYTHTYKHTNITKAFQEKKVQVIDLVSTGKQK